MATIDELYEAVQQFREYIESNMPYKHTVYSGTDDPLSISYTTNPRSFYFQFINNRISDIFYKASVDSQDWVSILSQSENIFDPTQVASEIFSFVSSDNLYGATGYLNIKPIADANIIFININISKFNNGTSQQLYVIHNINTEGYQPPALPVTEFIVSSSLNEHAILTFSPSSQISLTVNPNSINGTSFTVSKTIIVPVGLSNYLEI